MTKNTPRLFKGLHRILDIFFYFPSCSGDIVTLSMSIRRQVTLSHTFTAHIGMYQISGVFKYTPNSIQLTGQMIQHYLKNKHQLCQSVTAIFYAYNGPGHEKTCLRGF